MRFSPEQAGFETAPEQSSSPERRAIRPTLNIIVPENFTLEKVALSDALSAIVAQHSIGDSIVELRQAGVDYQGERDYPTPIFIRVDEVVGTESRNGWVGLVERIGEGDEYAKPQTVDEVLTHAQRILEMEETERNHVLNGIELAAYGRKFFVDSDGRHRVLTLKALSEMGCDVTISGMKVAQLG